MTSKEWKPRLQKIDDDNAELMAFSAMWKVWIDLVSVEEERDGWHAGWSQTLARAEKSEVEAAKLTGILSKPEHTSARTEGLREGLVMAREEIRKFGHAVCCGFGKPGSGAGNPLGACTCGHFKTLMAIDAALAAHPPQQGET